MGYRKNSKENKNSKKKKVRGNVKKGQRRVKENGRKCVKMKIEVGKKH